MKFIIKLHPEITIKSNSVRKRFTRILESNIRLVLKTHELSVEVRNYWDKLEVSVNPKSADQLDKIRELLRQIPGIEQALEVQESSYTDLDDVYQQVKAVWHDKLAGKSFAVRVKRKGDHDFTSTEVARYVGGGLNQFCETGGVNLTNPDVIVNLEIERDKLLLVNDRFKCLGGMPLPTQDDVLSLMSGGFDSGVASYQMIRRGARTHFVFFNLGGRDHEIGVREVSYFLWQKYSLSHKVKFIAVDFAPIVAEILEKVENSQMGVVLKRMMMRAASQVADSLAIEALVTGESLGQVSSQTLRNLTVIDQVTDKLILRPLICSDKAEIIKIAREIGTEDFAKTMPEYCGVISRKPTVRAVLEKIEEEEAKFDLTLIDKVVRESKVEDIRKMAQQTEAELVSVSTVDSLPEGAVVLDVRGPEEEEHNPLELDGVEVKHLPFYRIATQFGDLDQSHDYYLYCERGVMSKLQALLLHEQGFANVKVYRPK